MQFSAIKTAPLPHAAPQPNQNGRYCKPSANRPTPLLKKPLPKKQLLRIKSHLSNKQNQKCGKPTDQWPYPPQRRFLPLPRIGSYHRHKIYWFFFFKSELNWMIHAERVNIHLTPLKPPTGLYIPWFYRSNAEGMATSASNSARIASIIRGRIYSTTAD